MYKQNKKIIEKFIKSSSLKKKELLDEVKNIKNGWDSDIILRFKLC
jgi:hypothetical protein